MKKRTMWYKKIATLIAAGMLLAALPVQASSGTGASNNATRGASGNIISENGDTSVDLVPPRSEAMYYVEEIPFTVNYKPVSGNHAPEQTFVFVLEPDKSGTPLPKLTDTSKNKSNKWYAEEKDGKIYFTLKMSAITNGSTQTISPLIDMIEFDDPDTTYAYKLYQQIPKSGDTNYSAYIDQNAQGGKYDTTSYTIKIQTQLSNGKRTVGVSVFRGSNDVDKTIPEFTNEYKPPVVEEPPTEPPVEEPPTVLGALRSLPQVLGAMRDQIMTGDTSALTIATIVFAGTCVGLAIWLSAVRKKRENEEEK